MKRLLLLMLAFTLMGQDCETPTPPDGEGSAYCAGNDYSILDGVPYGWEQDGVAGAYSAILNGIPSGDRRSTVQVKFGRSYCSGGILDAHTVLTAAHCGYGESTSHVVYLPEPIPGSDFVDLGHGYAVTEHTPHPEYMEYVRTGDSEARKADLMVLHVSETLPGPHVGWSFYEPGLAPVCSGLVAQGLGRWEGSGLSLRETRYIISTQTPNTIVEGTPK